MSRIISLRLDDDLIERMDGAAGSGKRTEFVRSAIEAALRDVPSKRVSEKKPAKKKEPPKPKLVPEKPVSELTPREQRRRQIRRWAAGNAKAQELIAAVRDGVWSSASLERHFGWLALVYRKTEVSLIEGGLFEVRDGVLRACADDGDE